ncbi:PAS domain S-box protein, partial [Klebsiella pneumoniae]|uniref:PAS domain S-box protein n=1 Tax=Klebsiella pneumoniae TaxID=573 RepID=UPI0027309DAB
DLLFDPQELDCICQQLTQTGQLFLYETRLRRTDGSPVEVSMNILLRQESDGAIIEAFVADITERKRVQQRMRTLNEELEQRVGERT